ncbi:MAG: hypothetical protein ABL973_21090 [Micropepsaceae bacterium]
MIEKLFAPATLVYLTSASFASLWWASDLSRRVETIEHSTVTAERLARLEAEVHALGQATNELRLGVNELSRELRAH